MESITMNVQEAAKLYGVDERTMRRWCAKKILNAHRIKGTRPWIIDIPQETIKALRKESLR